MNDDKNYMVQVCGYEGIEAVFGVFTKEEAYDFFMELKRTFPEEGIDGDEYEYDMDRDKGLSKKFLIGNLCDYCNSFYYEDRKDFEVGEKYGINGIKKPDQVCIIKGNGKKAARCACDEFPDRPKMKRAWLY